MLRELHISNLAVIADARIELASGLNCFTGATGAGKSLVIGAIELLLGLRSPGEMLRPGADEGRVSGLFEMRDPELLKRLDAIADSDVSSHGGELLLTRRLYTSGRSSATLNGSPITLAMLKQVAEHLVDVHGQHDHQYLLKPANQIDVLDHFAGLAGLRQEFHSVYLRLREARAQLAALSTDRSLRQQQLELYRFQAEEIDGAALDAAELEELNSRASVLANLEKLKKDAGAVHSALYEADGSVLERLKMMGGVLGELALLDKGIKPAADVVREAALQLEDAAYDISRYLDRLDLDPAELAEVNDRLNTINRMLNKYGDPIAITLAYREEIGRKIAELERAGDDLSTLSRKIEPLTRVLREIGGQLSKQRRAAAQKLAPLIGRQLSELGMEKATFSIQVGSTHSDTRGEAGRESADDAATSAGFDEVEFVARTNPGMPEQPLRRIASGGEMSRIMLALKGVLAAGDRVSVLVFDEIDANVGGRLGGVIGDKLRALAEHHQVLCITHLPQIACYADLHLTVRKETIDKETRTTVKPVAGPERIEELSEMIGGRKITETTRAQARELLDAARPVGRVASPGRPRRSSRRAPA